MLRVIKAKNYKSIKDIRVTTGAFNVLIGENGAGKSNFLELIASYSAIIANSFTNEFMLSRGIRVVEPQNLFSCFKNQSNDEIEIVISPEDDFISVINLKFDPSEPFSPLSSTLKFVKKNNEDIEILDINELNPKVFYSQVESLATTYGCSVEELQQKISIQINKLNNSSKQGRVNVDEIEDFDEELLEVVTKIKALASINEIYDQYHDKEKKQNSSFVIYSPELSALRTFYSDSQIEPLGVNGEGLLRLLQVMQEHEPENFKKVCETIEVFQWVEKITVEKDHNNVEQRIKIIDRYMGREIDHRSANEGFLFVLFYAALFSSKYTPKIFAVDNIDASLNPKLCRVLIKKLICLAKENDKQAFVTTHNPAILDGLDLHDDEQRLFVVERDDEGATQLRRVGVDDLPKPKRNGETIKLSESFMRGHLGGLPTNF